MKVRTVSDPADPEDRPSAISFRRALPYLLTILGFALRLYRLQTQSLWWDEGISAYLASLDLPGVLAGRAGTQHPPLYYVMLHYWVMLTDHSEFSLRFFSLLLGTLTVPAVYVVTKDLFDDAAANVSAILTACSPLLVVYSQETRVYIFMPLMYLLLIRQVHRLSMGESSWRSWLILALLEAVALYLHYFAIVGILWLNLVILYMWYRKLRTRTYAVRWILSRILVAVALLPWLVTVARNWGGAGGELGFRSLTGEGTNLLDYARLVWHFFSGGKTKIIGDHGVFTLVSTVFAAVFLVSLLLVLWRDARRRSTISVLSHLGIPVLLSYAAWWWRPGSHPRYIVIFVLPLFVLLARIIAVLWRDGGVYRAASLAVIGAAFVIMALGLQIAYFDAGYYKDDVRSLGTYLNEEARGQDAILVDWTDYSVQYYYSGAAPIAMIPSDQDTEAVEEMKELLHGRDRVYLVHAYKAIQGLGGLMPSLLELNGDLALDREYQGYSLRRFDGIASELRIPELRPTDIDYGALRLTGSYIQGQAPAGNAVSVALRWRLPAETTARYACALRLIDGQGREVAWADPLVLNQRARTTDLWEADEEAITHAVIPIPVGTAPLTYTIRIQTYDQRTMRALDLLDASGAPLGQYFSLGSVRLTPAEGFNQDPHATLPALHLQPVPDGAMAAGLRLNGYRSDGSTMAPGERLGVLLQWSATAADLPQYSPRLALQRGDTVLAEATGPPVDGLHPTSHWREGEVVLDRRVLLIPPDVEAGPASLVVTVGSSTIALGPIEVQGLAHSFQVPPMQHRLGVTYGGFAELLGYDLECTRCDAGITVPITLYWRVADQPDLTKAHTVFTQLINSEGRLVGQHDGPPADGHRPTTGWLLGEVISDQHDMIIKDPAHRGPTRIVVGLYDSATVERVHLDGGADHLVLPTEILIEAP